MPTDGEATFVLGQRPRIAMRNTSGLDVLRLSDLEKFSFDLVDLDQDARVIPLSKEPFGVSSSRNSAGDELPRRFFGKLCGWTGEVIQLGNTRVRDRGPLMLTPDPSPPAVFDTRTLAATADFAGLYGRHSGELAIKVQNEAFRLHGLFSRFARAPQEFPDFTALEPTLVLPEAHMSARPTEEAWEGLPDSLADNFAAVYACRFFPSSMDKGFSRYTVPDILRVLTSPA